MGITMFVSKFIVCLCSLFIRLTSNEIITFSIYCEYTQTKKSEEKPDKV